MVQPTAHIEAAASRVRLKTEIQAGAEIKIFQVGTLKKLVFTGVGAGIENAIHPLRIESETVGVESPLTKSRRNPRCEVSVFPQRQGDRNRDADLHRGEFDTALFVVVKNKRACQVAVVFTFCPVNFVFKTTGKRGVRHGHAAPLAAVISHKTHVATENAGKTGTQIEGRIGKLGKMNVLGCRGKNREQKREQKEESRA